jgi:hypothetical protein
MSRSSEKLGILARWDRLLLSIVLLIVLSTSIASVRTYNSDDLYSYSLAEDIIQFFSLSGWTFSASPFLIPDAILSLPFAAITNNLLAFYLLVSPVQIIAFVLFFSFYLSRKEGIDLQTAMIAISSAAFIVAIVGPLLFRSPYFFLVEPAFKFAHHGAGAFAAVIMFLYHKYHRCRFPRFDHFLPVSAFCLLALSDLFFAVYFGALLLADCRQGRWRDVVPSLFMYGCLSALAFILSYELNSSLRIQMHSSVAGEKQSLMLTIVETCIVLSPLTAVALWLHRQADHLDDVWIDLYIGTVLVALFVVGAGLVVDKYSFRYLAIVYPVTTAYFAIALLQAPVKSLNQLAILAAVSAIALVVYLNVFKRDFTRIPYRDEIECLQEAQIEPDNVAHGTIVATYWPAKAIFETTKRQYNLVQVDGTLHPYNWIDNSRWRYLYPESQSVFVVTEGLYAGVIDLILRNSDARLLCSGKIILLRTRWETLVDVAK